jgi:ferredoxin-NADP reductase/ferredoxin
MTQLHLNEATYQCEPGESVLDALSRQGVSIPSSCRSGVCQTCMMQSADANVPSAAQNGLKSTLQAQNYFLACACHPLADMTISLPDSSDRLLSATVTALRQLNDEVVCVGLDCPSIPEYRAGQFINLYRDAEFSRSYSLASVPSDPYLRLHVRRLPDGRMSNWVHDQLKIGDSLQISAPVGSCFYLPGAAQQPLLLIGTGSGLAPLMGIVRDALNQQHAGEIYLYHGSRDAAGLYLVDELREMAAHYPNFHYTPCVSGSAAISVYRSGRAVDVALAAHPDLAGWRVYLCGNPDMVKSARKKAYLAKAAMNDIHADAFVRVAAANQ